MVSQTLKKKSQPKELKMEPVKCHFVKNRGYLSKHELQKVESRRFMETTSNTHKNPIVFRERARKP